jgi:hypothetical protein
MAILNQQRQTAATSRLTTPGAVKIAKELTPATTSQNDDELLSDAFASPKVKNLSALDDMTPRARDYIVRAK